MKFANHLLKEGRPLQENVVTLFDCLFSSVKILTVNADKNEKDDSYTKTKWWPVLIQIRRLFVCIESVLSHIESRAIDFTASLETVLDLASLKDLVARVPNSCERVRSLFEFLLLDSL